MARPLNGKERLDKQLAVAIRLAKGDMGIEAAKACGLTPVTVSRWRQEPRFRLLQSTLEILEGHGLDTAGLKVRGS